MGVAAGGIALEPGGWVRQPYRVEWDPSGHGWFVLPARSDRRDAEVYDLAALAEGAGAALEFVMITGRTAEDRATAQEHEPHVWVPNFGGCKQCGRSAERAAQFASRFGLLGLWALVQLGDQLIEPFRQRGVFGEDGARAEPLALVLHASSVFAQAWDDALAANDRDATTDYRTTATDQLLWGRDAEATAQEFSDALLRGGTPTHVADALRRAVLVDPTILSTLVKACLSEEDITRMRQETMQALGVQDHRHMLDSLALLGAETARHEYSGSRQVDQLASIVQRTLRQRRAAVKSAGIRPTPRDAEALTNVIIGLQSEPRANMERVRAAAAQAGADTYPFGQGLNRVLADVSMSMRRDETGRWHVQYLPNSLWAALHVELASRLLFEGRAPAACAGCGEPYWRKTTGHNSVHQRCAPGHVRCRVRLSRAKNPPASSE